MSNYTLYRQPTAPINHKVGDVWVKQGKPEQPEVRNHLHLSRDRDRWIEDANIALIHVITNQLNDRSVS